MKIEEKIDQTKGDQRVSLTVHRREKNPYILALIPCYEYHLYSFEGQEYIYIYVYRRGRIYKELLKKYISNMRHLRFSVNNSITGLLNRSESTVLAKTKIA
jgi:hypothetical protein